MQQDACCGEGGPRTPDQFIADNLPKLTETLLSILAEAPFQGQSTLGETSEKRFTFKSELLLLTILAFTRLIKGTRIIEKRKISLVMPSAPVPFGDTITIGVRAEKLDFVKEGHGARKRIFIALVNLSDQSVMLQEAKNDEKMIDVKFKVMPQPKGTHLYRAYICSGDGQIQKSLADKEVTVA